MEIRKSQNPLLYIHVVIWVVYILWWIGINYFDMPNRDNYTDTYGTVALAGSIVGIIIAKRWGMLKSRFGKSLFYFSLGLMLQFLGQLIYALFYRIGEVELAFPSVGDIPYLASNVAYILAVYHLLKVIVFNSNVFKPKWVLFASAAVTILISWLAYVSFLNLAIEDERGLIYQVVNVAYPFIQAFYFLIGFVALLQAKRISGGKLFGPVALVLVALIVQYGADFNFLYQSYHETWEAAGVNDLIFVSAYGFMALAILLVDRVRLNTLNPTPQPTEVIGEEVAHES